MRTPREGFEAWHFAQAFVEGVFDGSELSMADIAQVPALGEELPEEAIGVLAGAALPRTVGVAGKDVHFGLTPSVSCRATSEPWS